MSEPILIPENIYRWMGEFSTTANMLMRSKRGTLKERVEVTDEYCNANDELLRLADEAGI